jgi:hypothetical protein
MKRTGKRVLFIYFRDKPVPITDLNSCGIESFRKNSSISISSAGPPTECHSSSTSLPPRSTIVKPSCRSPFKPMIAVFHVTAPASAHNGYLFSLVQGSSSSVITFIKALLFLSIQFRRTTYLVSIERSITKPIQTVYSVLFG